MEQFANKQGSLLTIKIHPSKGGFLTAIRLRHIEPMQRPDHKMTRPLFTLTKKGCIAKSQLYFRKKNRTNAKLKWKKVNGISGYEIYRKE